VNRDVELRHAQGTSERSELEGRLRRQDRRPSVVDTGDVEPERHEARTEDMHGVARMDDAVEAGDASGDRSEFTREDAGADD